MPGHSLFVPDLFYFFSCLLTHVTFAERWEQCMWMGPYPTHRTWGSSSHLRGCLNLQKGQDLWPCENPLLRTQISPSSTLPVLESALQSRRENKQAGTWGILACGPTQPPVCQAVLLWGNRKEPQRGTSEYYLPQPLLLMPQCVLSQWPG